MMKRALNLSYIYSAISVFIGPALVFYTANKHRSGWDCGDSAWDPAIPIPMREAIYDQNDQVMVIGAYFMIAAGLGVLGYLTYAAGKNKQLKAAVMPVLLVIFMMLGYAAIIWLASNEWC